jgi:heme/copper-type cytochrome/quinol oxidase subunit 3
MADPSVRGGALTRADEELAFYHEAALNTAWTGARLAIGVVTSGLAAFVFAFFYLRSLNSHGLWYPSGFAGPKLWEGTLIMALIVASAALQSLGLQQAKAGRKGAWYGGALVAIVLGLAAAAIQIWQLTSLPFQPGASGFASVFTGASPVFAVLVVGTMIWLETLAARSRKIPEAWFTEPPLALGEVAMVQRFQASLSGFTLFWNFMAIVAVVMWVLFYLVH